jgi:hypothetical protein
MVVRHTCRNPSPAPRCRDRPSTPHTTQDIAETPPWMPSRSARHHPPPALSPRRQACHDPTDRFPEAETRERDRARCPGHVDVSRSGQPACPEHASRSRLPRPLLAPLFTRTSMAR